MENENIEIIKLINQELKKKIIIKKDLDSLLEQITTIENLLFQNINTPLSERSKGKIITEMQKIIDYLEKNESVNKSPKDQFRFLEKIKSELKKFLLIKIEIAFDPSPSFLRQLKNWFEENIKKDVVLDITKNPKIVGGIIIEYNGKYLDLSLAKKIDHFIEQKTYE